MPAIMQFNMWIESVDLGLSEIILLYFYDTMNEIQNRMERLKDVGLSESLTQKLTEVLKDNPYAKYFRSLKDLQSIEDAHIHLATNVHVDQRVYNLPGVDQVAAIWIEENHNNIQFKRDIVVMILVVMIHFNILYYYQMERVVGIKTSKEM